MSWMEILCQQRQRKLHAVLVQAAFTIDGMSEKCLIGYYLANELALSRYRPLFMEAYAVTLQYAI